MIETMIAGEKDPAKPARLSDPPVKAFRESLSEALRGCVKESHRKLRGPRLGHVDVIDAAGRWRPYIFQLNVMPDLRICYRTIAPYLSVRRSSRMWRLATRTII